MLSFKRLLYIVLAVIALGGVSLIYYTNESRPTSAQLQSSYAGERDFTEKRQVEEGERPRVWILGESGDGRYGKIYDNVRQFCEDIHLTAAGDGRFDGDGTQEGDLVIFCDASISRYADLAELEKFIAGGGRVILAAGLAQEEQNLSLWTALGIREKSEGKDYHDLVFEKPLLPVQPEQARYDGSSGSARIEVSADASVYIRDAGSGVPILYTYAWQEGRVCLINGTFLTDIRCMGFLTGAIGALLPDFVYPVLGIKAVFLDNFPRLTSADDELCRRVYGYSAEGFVRDVVWPAFQGISLRTDTPYTASIPASASSEESFGTADDELFMAIGRLVLQFGGELVCAADCPEDGRTGLPVVTTGNSMEDGNLLTICSALGAYGMVSHVFDISMMIAVDEDTAAWDLYKRQVSLFESEILDRVPWLEGRTLSQTGDDVRSYQDMDYGWKRSGQGLELNCSSAVKGQAFFYHTDGRVAGTEGLTCQDVGNGYYLLRVRENDGIIMLEEE